MAALDFPEGTPYAWVAGEAGNLRQIRRDLKERGVLAEDTLVATVMSNLGMIKAMEREGIPRTPVEIQDRINEISFNSSLQRELRAIQFVKRLSAEGRLTGRGMKEPLLHLLSDDALMTSLGTRTKVMPAPGLLARMKEAGRGAAEAFIAGDAANIGQRDSVDLPKLYG